MNREINIENIIEYTDIKILEKIENITINQAIWIRCRGVYVFWLKNNDAYIGRSTNVGSRLYQHGTTYWKNINHSIIDRVDIYKTDNEILLEKLMINKLNPEINSRNW